MSNDTGFSSCCLSGKIASGTPAGHEEEINHLPTYISEPQGGSKSKSIVLITDIFGYKLNNTRLLADEYAKAGFFVYVPDFFDGDAISHDFLQDVEPPLKVRDQLSVVDKGVKTAKVGATLGPWLVTHREAVVKPLIDGFINTIKSTPGTNKVGTVGFCWGGRYSILMAHGLADASFAVHPATIAVPGDFEAVTKPIGLAVGDQDSLLSMDEVKKIQDLLAEKNVPSEVKVYKDQVHGFGLRGDWSDEKDKKAMDESNQQGIDWFNKYLA